MGATSLAEAEVRRAQTTTLPGRISDACLAGVVARSLTLLGFVVGSRVIADNSFFTHLATGSEIVRSGSVPSTDPYSYTGADAAWTVQSWLPSVVYQVLNDSLGGWSIRAVNGLLVATLVHFLWKLLAPVEQLVPRVALAGGCILIGAYLWTPRPLLVGLVGFVLLIGILQRQVRLVWLLPVIYVWVNSHGSFPLAGVYLFLVIAGGWLDTRSFNHWHMRVAVVAALGGMVAAVNPVGWRLLWFPVHLLSRREALRSVAEWAPPSFDAAFEWVFVAFLGLLFVAARRSATWTALLPSAVFALSALMAVRNVGFASIVIAVSVAPSLKGLAGSVKGLRPSRGATLGSGAVVVGFGLAVFGLVSSAPVNVDRYPVAELEWLERRSLVATDEVRIAQRDFVGNYMTFKYGDKARVFVDDRFDFYSQSVLDDHRHLVFGGDFGEIVDRRAFNVVLWEADSVFAYWLRDSQDWRIVRPGADWVVACRVGSWADSRCR